MLWSSGSGTSSTTIFQHDVTVLIASERKDVANLIEEFGIQKPTRSASIFLDESPQVMIKMQPVSST